MVKKTEAVFVLGLLLATGNLAAEEVAVDVYTMGVGEHVFSHFGHAAICVTTQKRPNNAICYNYGTADFDTPGPLTWNFIRGKAKFWVSTTRATTMIGFYRRYDRSVWRQRLPLAPPQAQGLASALERSTSEEEKYYLYHHFFDNCTTRIRDLIDDQVGGDLKRKTTTATNGPSFRDYSLEGFRGEIPLLIATDLLLGRTSDRPTTDWEAMFLPQALRESLETHLGAKPVLVYERKGPPPEGPVWAGKAVLAGIGLALFCLLWLSTRAGRKTFVITEALIAIGLGLLAAVPLLLALLSSFEELRWNEVMLVLLPTDLLFAVLRGSTKKMLLTLRLGELGVLALLSLAGALAQPLVPLVVLAGAPLGAMLLFSDKGRAS